MKRRAALYTLAAGAASACAPATRQSEEPSRSTASVAQPASEQPVAADSSFRKPPPATTASARAPEAPVDVVAKLQASMSPIAVDPGTIARKSLWTWTTLEQGREIAGGGPVLSKETSAKFGPSAFDWELDGLAKKGDRLAKLLFNTGFAKKRFAWANTYAAALGMGGERYGTVLMRFDLTDDALILDWPRKRVVTTAGKPAQLADVFAEPARLAAVYWETATFREYVLVNASRIAAVHVGDAEVLGVFMRERAMVAELHAAASKAPPDVRAALLQRFSATLAFGKAADLDRVLAMEQGLATVGIDGLDAVVSPKATFALGTPRAALKDDCKRIEPLDVSFAGGVCQPAQRCTREGNTCKAVRRDGMRAD